MPWGRAIALLTSRSSKGDAPRKLVQSPVSFSKSRKSSSNRSRSSSSSSSSTTLNTKEVVVGRVVVVVVVVVVAVAAAAVAVEVEVASTAVVAVPRWIPLGLIYVILGLYGLVRFIVSTEPQTLQIIATIDILLVCVVFLLCLRVMVVAQVILPKNAYYSARS